MLDGIKVVDLSAPLGPDTVMWPGAPAPSADTLVTIADNGYFARLLHVFEHSGTHFDAPCHMVADTAAVAAAAADAVFSAAAAAAAASAASCLARFASAISSASRAAAAAERREMLSS